MASGNPSFTFQGNALIGTGLFVGTDVTAATDGVAFTAAQILGGIINCTGTTNALTFPTAASLRAACPNELSVGDTFWVKLTNNGSGNATLTAGTGITFSGSTTISAATSRMIAIRCTAPGAFDGTGATFTAYIG